MSNNQLERILQEFGLSENEAKVYLAALPQGQTTALQIARDSAMKRSTVYGVIESLQQKGLMSIEMKGLKKYFVAAHPDKLEHILEYKKEQLQKFLPKLAAQYESGIAEDTIQIYEGLDSVKSVYRDLVSSLGPKDTYDAVGDHDTWMNVDPQFFTKIKEAFVKKRVQSRLLLRDTPQARKLQANPLSYKIKLFPASMPIDSDIILVPKKVIIHKHLSPIKIIIINNESIWQTHREMYEIMWQSVE